MRVLVGLLTLWVSSAGQAAVDPVAKCRAAKAKAKATGKKAFQAR
jgi:hypothetical protein